MFILTIQDAKFYSQERLRELQSIPSMTWTPGISERFENYTVNQVRSLFKPSITRSKETFTKQVLTNETLPSSWDWTQQRPECELIRDYGNCSAGWQFSAAGTFASNRCIAKLDTSRRNFSEQYPISCDPLSTYSCDQTATNPFPSLMFLIKTGSPDLSCIPYKSGSNGVEGTCMTTCSNGKAIPKPLTRASVVIKVAAGENGIMQALQNGTVITYMYGYDDLLYYKSGVYQHVSGSFFGYQAVVIVGYGVENGTKYWNVIQNWGTSWGESGYFKILRGTDECIIEDDPNQLAV